MNKKYRILIGILLIGIFIYFTPAVSAGFAIDGNVSKGNTSVYAIGSLTTTNPNDIIMVFAARGNISSIQKVNAITDTAGLTWTKRAAYNRSATGAIEEWYAIAGSKLTNDMINVSWNGTGSGTYVIYAVSGGNTTTPFDVDNSLPGMNSSVVTLNNKNVNTTAANTMIIGGILGARTTASATCRTFTVGTTFTRIVTNNTVGTSCATIDTERVIVSAAQLRRGVNETGSSATTTGYVILADALAQDSQLPTWSSNMTDSTGTAGATVLHSVLWNETSYLSGYIFSFDNGSGTFVNNTFATFTGAANWSNVSKVVNSSSATIRWQVYANDSANNFGATNIFTYTVTAGADSCSCPGSGDWTIINGDQCTLSAACNIGTNHLRVMNGALRIAATGSLNAFGCYVQSLQSLFVINGGKLTCR